MAVTKRRFDLLLAFGLVAALSCKYDPHPPNGVQRCADTNTGKQCPTGYECRDGKCYNTPADAGGPKLDVPLAAGGSGGSGAGGSAGAGDTMAPFTDDSGVACGGLDRLCCANNECKAEATVCNGVRCVVCGSSGYICCANNTCLGSSICSSGNCVPCGAAGQLCCSNNVCNGPLVCTGGICGQPNPDGGKATLTSATYDTGIATFTEIVTSTETVTISSTHTIATTATRTIVPTVVRTASYSTTATATASETVTTTGSKADAGIGISTSTGTLTARTVTRTSIGIGTASAVSPGLPSTP